MRQLILTCLLFFGAPAVLAQATWPVDVLVPGVISVRAPADALAFDLSGTSYPPLEFPAVYPGGTLPLQLFSSSDDAWSVSLQISDIIDAEGLLLVPADQIMYRINGGTWLRANGLPQIIHTQTGPTFGWLEIRVELALELTGNEQAGNYGITTTVTAQTESF